MRALVSAAAAMSLVAIVSAQGPVDFQRDVRPLLSSRCFACHGPDAKERKAGLRLDVADGPDGAYRVRKGEAAVAPGDLAASELWRRVTSRDADERMPPPDAAHLEYFDDEELALLRRWIESGAVYEGHWSFTSPRAPYVPQVADADWSDRAIDRFVLARLEREGLAPSPDADRRTLLRRVTFDLTGLPPTREEIAAFLADERPDAYERLVDRLLQSPHYGEHMARHWLDLVRFADTNGMHHDHYRDLTPYRDWVIRAFDDNLGFDRFVEWQLAGDLLPEPTVDQIVASGWHRLHLIIDVGTALPEESHARNVIDRVTAFGTGFLGLTVQCAQCHDHKFDPITQRDFYRFAAFFDNLDGKPETGGRSGPDFHRGAQQPYVELPSAEQQARLAELDARIDAIDAERREFETFCAQQLTATREHLDVRRIAADELRQMLSRQPVRAAGIDLAVRLLAAEGAALSRRSGQAQVRHDERVEARRVADVERTKQLRRQRDAVVQTIPAAMVMKEREAPRETRVFVRGQYDQLGERVERGTPVFLPPLLPSGELPTRRDLATWLLRPEHPLTARVAVNRFWQQCFGTGLVKTSEDFGAQGEPPSHPELLDHLATTFVASGWDVKALLREMVLSRTYRQSSVATSADFASDPDNRMLSRGSRFRMDAEMIRDQVLASSGLLNPQKFGRSVKPPQPPGIWAAVTLPDSLPRTFVADEGDRIWRRSVYTFWKRALPPPQMTILDAPSREYCTARRERTNTPLQALLLLNEAKWLEAARHLALRELRAEASDESRIARIYEAITSQLPDEEERGVLREVLRDLRAAYGESPQLAARLCDGVDLAADDPQRIDVVTLAAWTMLASTIYNLDVARTRQ